MTTVSKWPSDCVDVLEREQAHIGHAATPRHLHGSGRDVDRDDLAPARLQLEGDASGAYADVEHAASDEAQRPPLHGCPATNRREIAISVDPWMNPSSRSTISASVPARSISPNASAMR